MTDDRPAITTHQMQTLHALLRDHGITGDKTVHDWIATWLTEHDEPVVESRKELPGTTAAKMIRDLERADVAHARGGLARALVALQAELPWVAKTKTAQVPTKSGGSYSYTYADLADVTAAAMPLLVKHGLAFTCLPRITERGGYELVGVLLHVSGEEREGALPLHGNDPQALGGGITYMRRYLLGCMLGIVTDDDADGRQAMGHQQTRQWEGPSTRELLLQIDADASLLGVTYEDATKKLRDSLGVSLDELDALEPWRVAGFAQSVRAHTEKTLAEQAEKEAQAARAALEQHADEAVAAERASAPSETNPAAPDDPWGNPS